MSTKLNAEYKVVTWPEGAAGEATNMTMEVNKHLRDGWQLETTTSCGRYVVWMFKRYNIEKAD